VLYTKGGTTGIARVVDLDFRFQVWVHIAVLKIHPEKVNPYFLAFALNSAGCYEQSQLFTRGATNNDLGLTRMVKILFALAPLHEQRLIVQYLDTELAKFDTLTAEAQRAIDLLQERRTALISAAVTGQIDVRKPPKN
jgi:type I restriction enzyme S subunit